ncbi:hypothetical protein ACP4OV_014313 [Aristida adscensionis]
MKRCWTDAATLEPIDVGQDVEYFLEHINSAVEGKVRLSMSKQEVTEINVFLTPLKRPRGIESVDDNDDDDDTLGSDESLDAYKDWLQDKGSTTVSYKDKDRHTKIHDDW